MIDDIVGKLGESWESFAHIGDSSLDEVLIVACVCLMIGVVIGCMGRRY